MSALNTKRRGGREEEQEGTRPPALSSFLPLLSLRTVCDTALQHIGEIWRRLVGNVGREGGREEEEEEEEKERKPS